MAWRGCFACLALALALALATTSSAAHHFETAEQLATAAGYKMETHVVQTDDGYLLTVHRLLSPNSLQRRGPVLLMHGFLGASDNWLLAGPGNGLGYILADEGYDVFLGNFRGNLYSRNHSKLPVTGRKFWKFSWQEMGLRDLPAMISLAEELGQGRVVYIGHSMAASALAALLSVRRQGKTPSVKAALLLAPSVYITPPRRNVGRLLLTYFGQISRFLEQTNMLELVPRSRSISTLVHSMCSPNSPFLAQCVEFFTFMTGEDLPQLDQTKMAFILGHLLSGSSVYTALHFVQNGKSEKFQAFDFGAMENRIHYNQTTPPEFDISLITSPIAVYYGDNDIFVGRKEAERFYNQLQQKIEIVRIPYANFTHYDFLCAKDVRKLVYEKLLRTLLKL